MSANYKEYKFSDLVEEVEERNISLEYGLDDIVGVTIEKGLIPTIANLTQTALDKFYIVKPDTFVYNPRTHGVRLGMGYNDTNKTFLTSWNNVAFRVKEDAKKIVLSKYLWIYFNRPEWDRQTNFMAWGSSTIVFAWNDFLSIKIQLPDLKEQEKIVNTYNAITKRIQLKQKINENLEKTAQCLFEKIYQNNESWTDGVISDLGEIVSGATPSTEIKEYFCQNGIHWLSPKDLTSTGYKFISKGETDITEAGYKSCSTKLMPKGTVLLTSRAPVGCLGIAENEICTNQGFKSIIPNANIQTAYIYYFLKKEVEMLKQNASGTTFDEISGSVLKSLKCKIPPRNIALAFNEQCKYIFNYQRIIEKEISKLQELKQLVISRISGM